MKETKEIKLKSVPWFFFIIRENKNSKQKMGGIYTVITSTLITAVTNTRSFQSNEWSWPGNA